MRRLLLALLLFAPVACSEPPQKEIDQAQAAIEVARAAGADRYAADEYSAAETALQKAHAAVVDRDYRQALSYAIDARQRAVDAGRQVAQGRAEVRLKIEAALRDADARADGLQRTIDAAETAKVPVRNLRTPTATLSEARQALQKARTALDAGNLEESETDLAEVRKKLDVAEAAVASIPPRKTRAPDRRTDRSTPPDPSARSA